MSNNIINKALILSLLTITSLSFADSRKSKVPLSDLQRFTTVVEHIRNYYVDSTEDSKLFENAIRGMLLGLDPHSAYLDKEEFEDLRADTSGKFGGLGIEVTLEDGFIKVISPIDGTPAFEAGIKPGDLIIRIDETPVRDLSLKEAVDLMRGKAGQAINLTIMRPGEAEPIQKSIKRAIIITQSVRSKILEENYAYFRVSGFKNDTGREFVKEWKKIKKKTPNIKGIVLDLRNNPGGILDASVELADAFLDKSSMQFEKVIVYTKGRLASSQIKEKALTKDITNNTPVVVLVNGGSASASEIVAGALQDHKRGVIMGTPTFGKGSVQTILPLKDNRGLKLTTALYYTPAGRSIQATGIKPDITVENINLPNPDKKGFKADDLLIKEANLQGHLKNLNNEIKNEDKNLANADLLYSDYQLQQALNLLKGIMAIDNNIKSEEAT